MKAWPLIIFAAAPLLLAEDFTLTDGTVLREATVQRKGTDELQVLHAEGVRRVSYDLLPRELQERYDMTPEQVEAHRQGLEQEAEERRQARRDREAARLAQLKASGTQPRYLSGADVLQLLAPYEKPSLEESAYLAAAWNKAESQRLGLEESVRLYAAECESREADYKAARAGALRDARSREKMKGELADEIRRREEAEREVKRLRKECEELLRENNKLWKAVGGTPRRDTTILYPTPPVIVPPIIVPGPSARPPRPPRPAPPARPVRPSRPSVAPPAPRPVPHCPPGNHSHTRRR